jgi:StAR-related lipid transfer protein 10
MDVGEIKIAEDSDFQHFRKVIDNHADWELNYSRDDTKVWTKSVPGIEFKMVKVY